MMGSINIVNINNNNNNDNNFWGNPFPKNVKHYYLTITVFDIKGDQKGMISKFEPFYFSSNMNTVFLQNAHLYGISVDHFKYLAILF